MLIQLTTSISCIVFALEWTRLPAGEFMLAQEWTRAHGQHAGLWPSWLLCPAQTASQTEIKMDNGRTD